MAEVGVVLYLVLQLVLNLVEWAEVERVVLYLVLHLVGFRSADLAEVVRVVLQLVLP